MLEENSEIGRQVGKIIERVRKEGDRAVRFYARKFDGVDLSRTRYVFTRPDMSRALKRIDPAVRSALRESRRRIEFFHRAELAGITRNWSVTLDGIRAGQIARPLGRAGLYVPGGRYPYPSTVLMGGIPAKVAGVKTVIAATPLKNLTDEVLAACALAGVEKLFGMGGPAAVAAMAFGTRAVPKVDKIVGPGNRYVTEAKRQVFGRTGIDGLAGPSEVAVWADAGSSPESAAGNLLAQAEHDPAARGALITTDRAFARKVRSLIPGRFLGQISFHVERDRGAALRRVNALSPEHLVLAVKNPRALLRKVRSAGAVFLGDGTPVPLGDYAAGPSHILPTGGAAAFSSGLSVKDFLAWSSVIENVSGKSARAWKAARTLAETEGLRLHALALRR